MADIYNPFSSGAAGWEPQEEQIGLVGPELAGMEQPGESSADSEGGEMAEMMEEALSVINSQAETIKKLMAMLSGEPAA
jgi:hypothetical protein